MPSYSDMFWEAHVNAGLCSCGCWYHGGDCAFRPSDYEMQAMYEAETCMAHFPPRDCSRFSTARIREGRRNLYYRWWNEPTPEQFQRDMKRLAESNAFYHAVWFPEVGEYDFELEDLILHKLHVNYLENYELYQLMDGNELHEWDPSYWASLEKHASPLNLQGECSGCFCCRFEFWDGHAACDTIPMHCPDCR